MPSVTEASQWDADALPVERKRQQRGWDLETVLMLGLTRRKMFRLVPAAAGAPFRPYREPFAKLYTALKS
jgi:hypothetical protein